MEKRFKWYEAARAKATLPDETNFYFCSPTWVVFEDMIMAAIIKYGYQRHEMILLMGSTVHKDMLIDEENQLLATFCAAKQPTPDSGETGYWGRIMGVELVCDQKEKIIPNNTVLLLHKVAILLPTPVFGISMWADVSPQEALVHGCMMV